MLDRRGSMIFLGKFVFKPFNDGTWIMEWTDETTGQQNKLLVQDINAHLSKLTKPFEEHRQKLVLLFRVGMVNPTAFVELPDAATILDLLPDPKGVIPGYYGTYQKFQWHLEQFCKAYGEMTGFRFTTQDIMPFVMDVREEF